MVGQCNFIPIIFIHPNKPELVVQHETNLKYAGTWEVRLGFRSILGFRIVSSQGWVLRFRLETITYGFLSCKEYLQIAATTTLQYEDAGFFGVLGLAIGALAFYSHHFCVVCVRITSHIVIIAIDWVGILGLITYQIWIRGISSWILNKSCDSAVTLIGDQVLRKEKFAGVRTIVEHEN